MNLSIAEKSLEKTVMVDFDGTICRWAYPEMPPPFEGVREALTNLQRGGFKVIIWTVRTASYWKMAEFSDDRRPLMNILQELRTYLNLHEIPHDDICLVDKPLAVAYIDDRAYQATGDNMQNIADDIIKKYNPPAES